MTECYFCAGEVDAPHGIHGCNDFEMCTDCRSKFITLHYFANVNDGPVLGFECKACGFTCDVPGKMVFSQETKEFQIKVDSMHNYCQSCGAASK